MLLSNGRLLAWGSGANGRLGNGSNDDRVEPCAVVLPEVSPEASATLNSKNISNAHLGVLLC